MNVITNEGENTLLNKLRDANQTDEINILVGYAYSSGFKAIISDAKVLENFLNTNVKILIGMDFDPKLRRIYSNCSSTDDDSLSPNEMKILARDIYEQFCNTDDPENGEVLSILFDKAKKGTLEIRKTKKSVHAKLYIFYEKGMTGTSFITGSSNFTMAGLKTQTEFNVLSSDCVNEAKTFFNNLWSDKNSVSILNDENAKDMREKVGLLYEPTPYEVFLKIIYEYFEYTNKVKIEYSPSDAGFNNYKYQTWAIKKALEIINDYNGVLISDVVGLGKSIIASVVARNLHNAGKIRKIYLICPPSLIDQWVNYMYDVDLGDHAIVRSVGQLKKIEEEIFKGRENSSDKREHLIIIDEAHRFRNSNTDSYGVIKSICQGNKVMLLTATPMHNTTSDIFSLIDLLGAKIFEGNSTEEFRSKIKNQEKEIRRISKEGELDESNRKKTNEISRSVQNYIDPVLIRRTRLDLIKNKEFKLDLEKQQIEFNDVADPEPHDYKLGEYSAIYIDTLEKISPSPTDDSTIKNSHFMGVRYNPLQYLIDDKDLREQIVKDIYGESKRVEFALEASRNLSKFMRHLLIRRFESSIQAFRETIDNLIEKYETIKDYIEQNKYPIYKSGNIADLKNGLKSSSSEETDYLDDDLSKDEDADDSGIYLIKDIKSKLEPQFFIDFDNDLKILKDIKETWSKIVDDKKFDKLKEKLIEWQKENKNRKIIIFSEFVSTVNYLHKKINEDIEINNLLTPISFTSKDKASKRRKIIKNFDASINDPLKKENDHFLLITTDTLSEGINLHRAGIIINYDIPYNPTKVIQRVGRINRIDKKVFSKIFIHNFVPRIEAQGELKNWQICNFKLKLINAIFGNDTKILQKEENIERAIEETEESIKKAFSLKNNTNIMDDDNELSWDTEYKNIFDEIKNNPQVLEKIKKMPNNLALLRKNTDKFCLISVKRFGSRIEFTCLNGDSLVHSIPDIFSMLKAEESEEYNKTTDNLKEYEKKIKYLKNPRAKANSHDSIIYIKDLIKKVDDKEINLSENNLDYITSLSRFAKKGGLAKSKLKFIVQTFKSESSYENKIEMLKKEIPESSIYITKENKSHSSGDFIVREELS